MNSETKPIIDIIVPHYDEPWSVGRNFFLMLAMQRGVNFDKIRVLVVQDGEENTLDWEDLFTSCPYQVDVLTIPHGGVTAARNAGIHAAEADWVMFCDFDDTFADVYSMRMILNVLPTNMADVLWMSCYREERYKYDRLFIDLLEEDFTNTFGKLYRRQWLVDENLEFNTDLPFEYDTAFNRVALSTTSADRVMRITTSFNMYTKTYRADSYNYRAAIVPEKLESVFYAGQYVTEELERRECIAKMRIVIAETFFSMYFLLNSKPYTANHDKLADDFRKYYNRYKNEFEQVHDIEIELCYDNISSRILSVTQELFNYYRIEPDIPDLGLERMKQWFDTFGTALPEDTGDAKEIIPADTAHVAAYMPRKNERVVVYCGTCNTYPNILASVKSLLANTRIDRVYLLIEDDTFPYDLPDCVTVMNVSDQQFFPESGPNYKNAWTYMCMMRAVFTKLLPGVSKVLSLDIDIVVNDDIGCLWDIDLDDYYLAGVTEVDRDRKNPGSDYINFGVVMMNLDNLRRDGIDDSAVRLINTDRLSYPEQDALNTLCHGHILPIPNDYNYTPFTHLTGEPNKEIIVHYAGIQYWKHLSSVKKYADMTWDQVFSYKKKLPEQQRVAVYCGTKDVYKMMAASAKSLLYHSGIDKIYFLIEDDSFPEPLPPCVRCINVSGQQFFRKDGPNYHSRWTYMVLLRAAFSQILHDEDVILSLDVDTIIKNRIDGIWNTDLSDAYFAAVPESQIDRGLPYTYYNFGVMLMNLRKLRDDRMDLRIIADLNTTKYNFNEQDCMNKLCRDHVATLPSDYNVCAMTDHTTHPCIYHYAGAVYSKLKFHEDSVFYKRLSWSEAYNNLRKCVCTDHGNGNGNEHIVVYMGARNYYHMLVKTAKSMLYYTKPDKVYFLIEDDTFPEPLPDIIQTINVSGQPWFKHNGPNCTNFYTFMTLMRAALSKIFPNYDRVLLLDPDTVVTDDISPIWDTDLSGYYVAGVPETRNNDHHMPGYINAGVMLLNLRKLREDRMDDRIINEINAKPYQHLEQDVINFQCEGYILHLDPQYNASFVTDPTTHPRISHYLSSSKPLFHSHVRKYADMPWDKIMNRKDDSL